MTPERILRGRAARLSLWNRLFHGVLVSVDELNPGVLCEDSSSPDERAAYVTLRACVALATSERHAVRCALRIAVLYWFSNIGERRGDARKPLEPKRTAFHLGEAVGMGFTWDEAVATMKRKPIDALSGQVQKNEYAKQWSLSTKPAPKRGRLSLGGDDSVRAV